MSPSANGVDIQMLRVGNFGEPGFFPFRIEVGGPKRLSTLFSHSDLYMYDRSAWLMIDYWSVMLNSAHWLFYFYRSSILPSTPSIQAPAKISSSSIWKSVYSGGRAGVRTLHSDEVHLPLLRVKSIIPWCSSRNLGRKHILSRYLLVDNIRNRLSN